MAGTVRLTFPAPAVWTVAELVMQQPMESIGADKTRFDLPLFSIPRRSNQFPSMIVLHTGVPCKGEFPT
ncbi:MAG: hypothetical protein A2Y64_06415 [Candidatus Coatesbacteria bacterium RBG_13_66_14]|uniref:Uncharacterized protein n=1 Tax=Candidatus Coatesbacteria bacterium RBG_13_66_14 TaxID=1817816 RepID=A0A1F5FB10_9BACT|nr:MAG: hypothetical protein A2Y64_06415 [Candidatus Coatesbacteria bacterium RBG_13_66_14]